MNSVIYNPQTEYDSVFKNAHREKTEAYFEALVRKSGVNADENRETVRRYNELTANLARLRRKFNFFRFLRVVLCITVLLIPLVIWKLTPAIRQMRSEIESADKQTEALLRQAEEQMGPLNALFRDEDSLKLVEDTVPLLSFLPHFSEEQHTDMRENYDFADTDTEEQSSLALLSGRYNENPFLFESRVVHTMGTETYHGYKTIHWTETYRDSKGNLRTRTRTETLHATVTKPKPFYSTEIVLHYGAQGAPDLSFSRDATFLDDKSDRALERYVKRGERKLKRKTDKAIRGDGDFMSMSNTDFEVIFHALDRTNEVQFRTLFTPLAQTNMVELLLSDSGFGDDFRFVKQNRMNRIISTHSRGRSLTVPKEAYVSYDFDAVKENFLTKNETFFKAVYFDFAPLWAIPMYQERPVHSLKEIPDSPQLFSAREGEVLANAANPQCFVHAATQTQAILKTAFEHSENGADTFSVTAHTYSITPRVDVVSVWGGDGRLHNVSVPWDEYGPLTKETRFSVARIEDARDRRIVSAGNGLCMFETN